MFRPSLDNLKSLKLNPQSKEIVLKTAPVVAENLSKIIGDFYPRMFRTNPEVLQFFNVTNQVTGRQPHALAESVLAAVGHLDNMDQIVHELMVIGHKHCALGILPEHYKIVHDNFLAAVANILGEAVTPEIGKAWSDVLMHIAAACIDVEEQIYTESASRPGNWHGKETKEFKISKIIEETPTVKSFLLKRADGSPAPNYTPGQFISVHINPNPEKHPLMAPRHYTISSPTHIDGCLRITVREIVAEDGKPAGEVSSWLHNVAKVGDVIKVRPPFGIFTRDYMFPPQTTEEVYLSSGIGLTPVSAMSPLSVMAGCKTAWLHCEKNEERHAFRQELGSLQFNVKNFHYDEGKPGNHYTIEKALETLRENGFQITKNTRFMVCGTPGFMKAVIGGLHNAGVDKSCIHHEAFGPSIKV